MKTKTLLQTTVLTILMMLLTTFHSNAQIQLKGLAAYNEGFACWDADGSGPEPEAYGHEHPFGWGSSLYYGASRDYIDPDPDAALCHFLDNIVGFPLFVQALSNNGFTASQVKMKTALAIPNDDIEGEDWFTINNTHYYNRYGAYFTIELNGEPMISAYAEFFNIRNTSPNSYWVCETNFSKPFDISENSSAEVQEVTAALLADIGDEELRLNLHATGATSFEGPGIVNGSYFNVTSGNLEIGLPELPFSGLASNNQGLACWDADGTGPEPEAYGHTYEYEGNTGSIPYYVASRDYDGIDPDKNASAGYFTDELDGFPNLKIQLEYRGYTLDQLKLKVILGTLGNDIENIDWGYNGSIHWYYSYGYYNTIELAGEPILEYVADTNYSYFDIANMDYWYCNSTLSKLTDISSSASTNAQYVAMSFLKDLGGHSIGSFLQGYYADEMPEENGRIDGVFQQFESSKLIAKQPTGTHIWDEEVSGTWDLARSPYIVMGALEIPDGETLIIEPGVVVKFNSTGGVNVQGCLLSEGTDEHPIIFEALDQNVRWGGLMWDQTPVSNDISIVKHCTIEYAYSYETELGYNCGGALRTNIDKLKISHCTFRNNLADNMVPSNCCGGAVAIFECSPHISHCIFYNNSSPWGGALAVCSNSNPVIDNCLFYDNKSTYSGGGGGAVLVWSESNSHFVNCTFADNYAADAGGAVELEINSTGTFTNCIFWGNKAGISGDQISVWDLTESFLNVYYSDLEGGENGITPGFQGEYFFNKDEDPGFLGAGNEPYYALDGGSDCVNGGTEDLQYLPENYIFPEFCLEGNPRIWEEIDMGSYEFYNVGVSNYANIDKELLNVFPNPINSNPSIEFYVNNDGLIQLTIMDIHGRVISELPSKKLKKGNNKLVWNAEKMSAGLYFCRLQIGNKVVTRKVIKLN